jgi:hypothetical protein
MVDVMVICNVMYFAFKSNPINNCNLSQHFHFLKCANVVTKCVMRALQLHKGKNIEKRFEFKSQID